MSKTSQKQIEKDENKVLRELMINSSQSIDNIAKKLGVSRQKIWRIVKKLEKEKSIWGYTAVVNNDSLGLNEYFLLLKRSTKPIPKDILKSIVLKDLNNINTNIKIIGEETYFVNGEYDIIIKFKTDDIISAKQFCEDLNRRFYTYFSNMKLLEVLIPLRKNGIFNPQPEKIYEIF